MNKEVKCRACSNNPPYNERSILCKDCMLISESGRDPYRKVKCDKCGKLHHPTKNKSKSAKKFCSRECFGNSKFIRDVNKKIDESNKEVIDYIKNTTPPPTLKKAGNKFGISRERIRQIWVKETGNSSYDVYREWQKEERKRKKKRKGEKIKYNCSACGKGVKYKDSKYKRNLCNRCHTISSVQRRNPHITFECEVCGDKFHPHQNHKAPTQKIVNRFCSPECYTKSGDRGAKPDPNVAKRNKKIIAEYKNIIKDFEMKITAQKHLANKYELSLPTIQQIIYS